MSCQQLPGSLSMVPMKVHGGLKGLEMKKVVSNMTALTQLTDEEVNFNIDKRIGKEELLKNSSDTHTPVVSPVPDYIKEM